MSDGNGVSFDHLDRMSDSTGLIQHAIYSIPRRDSGYTTDDNARALRLCAFLWNTDPDKALLSRASCYLSFIEHARCSVRGFHNFLGYQRDWLDAGGTGDCQGQAVLALAEVASSRLPDGLRRLARELLDGVLPALTELRSLRAQAYVIQAWAILHQAEEVALGPLEAIARKAADRLAACFERSQRSDWHWFESQMTYANAVLPHAMFHAAERWPSEAFQSIAEQSMGFLNFVTTEGGVFWPVGNRDWYAHGECKSPFDQQPVEASTMAAAALLAYQQCGDPKYLDMFERSHQWFLGKNSHGILMVDLADGACYDGLSATGANQNQGAESMLAYLWTETLHRTVVTSTITRGATHEQVST